MSSTESASFADVGIGVGAGAGVADEPARLAPATSILVVTTNEENKRLSELLLKFAEPRGTPRCAFVQGV